MVSSSSVALGAGVPGMVAPADFVGKHSHARQPHDRAIALNDLHPPACPCSCLQEEDEVEEDDEEDDEEEDHEEDDEEDDEEDEDEEVYEASSSSTSSSSDEEEVLPPRLALALLRELSLKPECGVRAPQEETSSRTEVLPAGTRVVVQVL
jgi:hypothetical protein